MAVLRRNCLLMMVILCFVLVFTANGMAKVVIKYAHINNPGMPAYDAADFFADKVKELSNGEIECEVFPSGTLGGEREMVESLILGNIHISHPNIAVLTLNYPQITLYQMPFLFKDFYHTKRVAESKVGQELNAGFEKETGLSMVMYFTEAPRGLYNNTRPIYEPAQLKGLKIRIMESELYRDMFGELGVAGLPTPLSATEMYSALATNLVEFADSPIDHYYTTKLHEVAKYYSLLDHVTGFKAAVMNKAWFDGLAKEHQDIIMEAFKQTEEYQNELSDSEQQKILDEATCNGVYVNLVNKCAFKEVMEPVYDKWIKKLGEAFATEFIEKANELASGE